MSLLISVIIPTFNRADFLEKCLFNIESQTLLRDDFEVIVTDDGNGSSEMNNLKSKFGWVQFIKGPQKGPASNRNNGAREASGKWLVFLDDDCIPDMDILSSYKAAVEKNPEIKVFEGRIYVDRPRKSLNEFSPINETGGYLWSCNFCIKKDLFESLRGFDEAFPFPAMEDVDLRLRIEKQGEKINFVKEAAVCHPWRERPGWKKVNQHNISTFIFLKKHPEQRRKINSIYYLQFVGREIFKNTIPGLIKYKGRGFFEAIVEHICYLKMSYLLLLNRIFKK